MTIEPIDPAAVPEDDYEAMDPDKWDAALIEAWWGNDPARQVDPPISCMPQWHEFAHDNDDAWKLVDVKKLGGMSKAAAKAHMQQFSRTRSLRSDIHNAVERLRVPDAGLTADWYGRDVVGFVVPIYPERSIWLPYEELSTDMIRRFLQNNRDVLSKSGYAFSGYHEPETGVVWLDICWVTKDVRAAFKVAGEQGLESIVDITTMTVRHLPGKHNQKLHGHGGGGSGGYVEGRDITGSADYDRISGMTQEWAVAGTYGDGALAGIQAAQGFDGKPQVGSKDDVDKAIDGGDKALYRGWGGFSREGAEHADEHAEQFATGKLQPGYGTHGNGTYAATNRDYARAYAEQGTTKQTVQRMALRKEAKVVDSRRLEEERLDALASVPRGSTQSSVMRDPGRFAALKGYDAIHYRDSESSLFDEVAILNRTALTVQKGA